jgi:hypothetical protein
LKLPGLSDAPVLQCKKQSQRQEPHSHQEITMLDPADVIKAAISSAFVKYPRDDDPDWSTHWIKPEDCAHLTRAVLLELKANGFQIVRTST